MARAAVCAACAAWCGALSGLLAGRAGVAAPVVGGAALWVVARTRRRRVPWIVVLIGCVGVAAAVSGLLAAERVRATLNAAVPSGHATVIGTVGDEPAGEREPALVLVASGHIAIEGTELPPFAVAWPSDELPAPGDLVWADGRLRSRPGFLRGDPVAGVLTATDAGVVAPASSLLARAATSIRHRVGVVLERAPGQDSALLAGFLIGDTSGLDRLRIDELRASGLAHYVAVSGSNVALFIAAWLLLVTPFAGPRARAATAIVGIVLFTFVTRWEASVLRAGAMAGLVFAGRFAGVPVEPVVALGWGVTALLLVSGDLAASVGFQLSVAATVGVMVGTRRVSERRPRRIWSILGATGGAQLAVAPLVLFHFGSVPLMAPVANLLAAPLVVAATSLAGISVLAGGGPALVLARLAADGVLTIARVSAGWPQLGWPGVLGVVGLMAAARWRPLRRPIAVGLAVATVTMLLPRPAPSGASLTALDVGQGDAVVVRDGEMVMLVDGGRDPVVLRAALRRHGIGEVDLLVITHGDADHVGGLVGIGSQVGVERAWVPAFGEPGPILEQVVEELETSGTVVTRVSVGAEAAIGRIDVAALGPRRRYAADNDGAVVLLIEGGGTVALLPSDVEAVAQAELPDVRPDLMLVPHHGSATTDLAWLSKTVGSIAIVSVGPNTYGHPAPEILDALRVSGARVHITRTDGDITVPLLPP